ncbi:MAG: hypothetical protein Q4Q07_01080 [Tissierellia bacterium]|nr:hypothetical protein [Tissierellia bacterium]
MKINYDYCPFCEGKEFIEGKQNGHAVVRGENIFSSQILYHIICKNCGSVVHSFVKEPEKLLKKKNR